MSLPAHLAHLAPSFFVSFVDLDGIEYASHSFPGLPEARLFAATLETRGNVEDLDPRSGTTRIRRATKVIIRDRDKQIVYESTPPPVA